jgi:hypothetical protein
LEVDSSDTIDNIKAKIQPIKRRFPRTRHGYVFVQ